MTESTAKRLILVTALEAEVQGMIAENKRKEQEGFPICYAEAEFYAIAEEIRLIANKHEDQL